VDFTRHRSDADWYFAFRNVPDTNAL
jgi:hypothetical protein